MTPQAASPTELASWRELLTGLEALGVRLLKDDFPNDPVGRNEAFRHLTEQLLCWLEWSIGYGDASAPAFQRQNDLVTPWGGPNADNVYRHARVSPRHRYRIRGRMNSCEEFALAIREGFRHTERPATLAELTASDIGIGRGDDFELLLGGAGSEPNRVPLPEGAIMCSIREYYFDWQPREPATFTIECLDGESTERPSFAESIHEALDLTERSLVYWNDYLRDARIKQDDNSFGTRIDVPRGLQRSQFAFCFYDLGPGEALVVESDLPDARYWSLQLYGMHFFRAFDVGRITSLNHRQATVGADRRLHFVLADRDPGVPNWLDTMNCRVALLNFRYFWGSTLPTLETRVVPFDSVRAALPVATRVIDPTTREQELHARRDHLAWRFRT